MPRKQLSLRAVATGALLSLGISVFFAWARLGMATTGMSADYITAAAIFFFFVLTAAINPLLKLVRLSWGFDRSELIVIYIMMIVASAIPTWGFTANLIALLPSVFYYATPENEWAQLLHPHVTEWLVPQDPEAIRYFFEGLPAGQPIPWSAWMTPLLAWVSFILSIYLMMITIMIIMRRHWVEHDRLTFPLLQLPMDMTEEGEPGSKLTPFVKQPLMWVGFALPFLLLSTSALNHYYPFIPEISLRHSVPLFGNAMVLTTNVNFIALGLSYFLSLDVSLSVWLFHLLAKTQIAAESLLGFSLHGRRDLFTEGSLSVAYQGMGAMLVFVLLGLWTSRSYLKQVWAKITRDEGALEDGDELLSYRAAAVVLTLSALYATGWLTAAGVPLPVSILFMAVAFAIFYGLARIVAEGGLGFARAQMTAQPFVINAVGTEMITAPGLVTLGFSYCWAGDLRTMVMASAISGMKLADSGNVRGRLLMWAMLLAIIIALAGSVGMLVWMGYRYGGINLDWWFYNRFGEIVHSDSAHKIANPIEPLEQWSVIGPRYLFAGIGAAVMGFLMWARHHWVWWPTHYLGFPIGATLMMNWTWFSVFLGWVLKALILRYGGVFLYHRLRPLFLGLILGHVFVSGFWVMFDFVTGETGNEIPVY